MEFVFYFIVCVLLAIPAARDIIDIIDKNRKK